MEVIACALHDLSNVDYFFEHSSISRIRNVAFLVSILKYVVSNQCGCDALHPSADIWWTLQISLFRRFFVCKLRDGLNILIKFDLDSLQNRAILIILTKYKHVNGSSNWPYIPHMPLRGDLQSLQQISFIVSIDWWFVCKRYSVYECYMRSAMHFHKLGPQRARYDSPI